MTPGLKLTGLRNAETFLDLFSSCFFFLFFLDDAIYGNHKESPGHPRLSDRIFFLQSHYHLGFVILRYLADLKRHTDYEIDTELGRDLIKLVENFGYRTLVFDERNIHEAVKI